MFLHIGNDKMVSYKEIVAILDYSKLKKASNSNNFLAKIMAKEMINPQKVKNQEIKTIVITKNEIFLTSISSGTIEKRMGNNNYGRG